MQNLLNTLRQITACGTSKELTDLCDYQLSNVVASRTADYWTADQRVDFMMFATLFRSVTIAAFDILNALEREGVSNLTSELIVELESALYELSSFQSGIDFQDLVAVLDYYISILVKEHKSVDKTIAKITGHYFKNFFLTLHALKFDAKINASANLLKLSV
jgi:hypothetical protein